MSSRPLPGANPLPVQNYNFTKEQLADPDVMNVFFQQVMTAINSLNGTQGRVVLPKGLDVKGTTVSNLGPPQHEGDAISSGHAKDSFGPAAQQQQLDVGKPHALKGLNQSYAMGVQNGNAIKTLQSQISGVVTVLASGGTAPLSGAIIQMGHTAAINANPFSVTFPKPYNNAPIVVACDDLGSGASRIISVINGSVTTTGFNLQSDGTGNGAWWIAIGN